MLINECPNFLLTIGYGRSGSTMLGQILNQHPNFLVTTEFRFLQKYYHSNKTEKDEIELVNSLIKQANKEHMYGSKKILNNQKDNLNINLKLSKKNILYYGDKKSGGNTTIFIKDQIFCESFMNENKNLKIIINTRNPFNVMKSIKQSQFFNRNSAFIKCDEKSSEEEIFQDILYYQNYSFNFYKKYKNRCFILYYDDIIINTENTMKKLFSFFNVEYIKDLNNIINSTKKEDNKIPENFKKFINLIIDKNNLDFFKRYIN
tara:strand:+ start:532 stop:1314 length:783 start_codon:yes stop_codon:yes gene_type:complete